MQERNNPSLCGQLSALGPMWPTLVAEKPCAAVSIHIKILLQSNDQSNSLPTISISSSNDHPCRSIGAVRTRGRTFLSSNDHPLIPTGGYNLYRSQPVEIMSNVVNPIATPIWMNVDMNNIAALMNIICSFLSLVM